MHHFYATELYALEAIFPFIRIFFLEIFEFWGFLSVPHLVENYAKIVDERGRNFMCDRTFITLRLLLLMHRLWYQASFVLSIGLSLKDFCLAIYNIERL